jgi:transcriptional regulator with XRE-family HTH domain
LYENLKFEMQKAGISNEQIAEDLGIHRNSVGNKINGNSDFTVQEAIFIKNYRFPQFTFEYLFKKNKPAAKEG